MNSDDICALFDAFVNVLAQRVADRCNADTSNHLLYTVAELAARYNLSKSAIRQRIKAGDFGEVMKIGSRCYRVTAEGVRRYEATHMTKK